MSVSRLYAVSGFLPPLDRRSSRDAVAITVSLAVHLAVGLVLLRTGFIAADAPPAPPEVVIQAEMTRPYVPPKAPTDAPRSQPQVLPVRQVPLTTVTPPYTLDAVPADTPPIHDAGPILLPQSPPIAASEGRGTAPPSSGETPAPPRLTVVTSPRWLRQPSPDQMQRAYPVRAAEAGLGGEATINCKIMIGGGVTDCQIVNESPRGDKFGAAAVQLARYFLLDPRTENGQAVDGARVTIPLTFKPPTD